MQLVDCFLAKFNVGKYYILLLLWDEEPSNYCKFYQTLNFGGSCVHPLANR